MKSKFVEEVPCPTIVFRRLWKIEQLNKGIGKIVIIKAEDQVMAAFLGVEATEIMLSDELVDIRVINKNEFRILSIKESNYKDLILVRFYLIKD